MLPTSQSNGQINPNLSPIAMAPVATAPNLMLLNEAFRQGLVTADDLRDRLTLRPLREKVQAAQANDELSQLSVAPARRQQEMTAAEQAAKLRDLQIQEGTNVLSDYPGTRDYNQKLRSAQIQRLDTENKYLDPKEQAGVEDAKAQAELRKAQAAAALSKMSTPGATVYSQQMHDTTIKQIDRLLAENNSFSSGTPAAIGRAISSHVPGSQMTDFNANLEALTKSLALNQLAEMKAASANGSTGLGRVSNTEFAAMSGALGALGKDMSPAARAANLQIIKDSLTRWEAAKQTSALAPGAEGPPVAPKAPEVSAPAAPAGVPEISSDDAFTALPVGAQFRRPGDPSNRIWTKQARPVAPAAPTPAPAPAPSVQPPVVQSTPPSPPAASGVLPTSSIPGPSPRSSPAPHELILQDLKHDLLRIKAALGLQ